MTAPELKPCPFCGGEAHLRDDASHSTAYFIGCATEECFGEIHWGKSEAEVIAAWNTRATPLAAALAVPEVRALVEAAQMACNRLETIADKSWWGDGRDLKRSIVGVFADFDAALLACGSEVPADLRRDAEHVNKTPETEHDAGNVLTDAALRGVEKP